MGDAFEECVCVETFDPHWVYHNLWESNPTDYPFVNWQPNS